MAPGAGAAGTAGCAAAGWMVGNEPENAGGGGGPALGAPAWLCPDSGVALITRRPVSDGRSGGIVGAIGATGRAAEPGVGVDSGIGSGAGAEAGAGSEGRPDSVGTTPSPVRSTRRLSPSPRRTAITASVATPSARTDHFIGLSETEAARVGPTIVSRVRFSSSSVSTALSTGS